MTQEQPEQQQPQSLTLGGAELGRVLERQKLGELHVHSMKRGKTNGEWQLFVSYPVENQEQNL